MAYRIQGDETIADALRRIAVEQIDAAIAEIDDPGLDRAKAVHQVRRRIKKVRGALRLGRDGFPRTYRRDNAAFRDVARNLAGFRDAQSASEAFDAFCRRYRGDLAGEGLERIRARLVDVKLETNAGEDELERRLAQTRTNLAELRRRAEIWPLEDDGFETAKAGLERLYSDGRDAMEKAYAAAEKKEFAVETTVAFHEWRKQVKYLGFALRILSPAWKESLDVHRKTADRIEDRLGEEHDLALLCERVEAEQAPRGFEDEAERFLPLARRRRAELRESLRPLGDRFYAEDPGDFARRVKRYWKIRQERLRDRADAPTAGTSVLDP